MGRQLIADLVALQDETIEVRVAKLSQLFNAIDPSPFRERDLDPGAVDFIVGWGKDLPAGAPLGTDFLGRDWQQTWGNSGTEP